MATKAEVKKHDHEQWVKLNRYAQDLVFVFITSQKVFLSELSFRRNNQAILTACNA